MYQRFAESSIREALADTPVVSINGPRQSGKTTLARKVAGADWTYLTLDDATLLKGALADPVGFIRGIDRAVIDEVQRAPDLLLAIKQSVDEDRRHGRFLLTGSAHILALPKVKESLAGRMEVVTLYPLSRSEVVGSGLPGFIDIAFSGEVPRPSERISGADLTSVVVAGGYPEVLSRTTERRRRDWCRSYLDAIVERDVRDIAAVDKVGELRKLIEVMAQFSGQLTNLSEIGGRAGIDHKTADRYVSILEQLFIVRRLRPWFRNELKRLLKTPKIHFLDSGLLAATRGYGSDRLSNDRSLLGHMLESFVYSELVKQASWSDERISFFHYRDKDQVEVDILLESDRGGIVCIEVKASATVGLGDFRGIERISQVAQDDFKIGMVLYDGDNVVPFGPKMFAVPISSLWRAGVGL